MLRCTAAEERRCANSSADSCDIVRKSEYLCITLNKYAGRAGRGQILFCYNPRALCEDAFMKKIRQKAILDLVRSQEIASQEELLEGLLARKIDVSQSTLSRDIQELGLAKSGGVYTVMGAEPPRSSDETIRRTIREFLTETSPIAQNIVVLKTGPGHASTLSRAIDEAGWEESRRKSGR